MVVGMRQPAEDWQRLADHVRAARLDAGYPTIRAFAAAIGITERTLGKLENGERVSSDTLATVARAVGWPPDGPRRILAGGGPAPAPVPEHAVAPAAPAEGGPGAGSLAADAALIFPDDPAAQTLLVRAVADIGSLRELAGWITWQRKVAVEGFPEDRREDAAGLAGAITAVADIP